MTKNKFFPYALNSSPLHPQLPPPIKGPVTIHHLRRGVGVGGFGGITWFSRGEGGLE